MIDFDNIGHIFLLGVALGFAYSVYSKVKGWIVPKPDPIANLTEEVRILKEGRPVTKELTVLGRREVRVSGCESFDNILVDVSDVIKHFDKTEKKTGINPRAATSEHPYFVQENGKCYLAKEYDRGSEDEENTF